MTIGDRIRSARKEKGLTQSELAEKLGISYMVISQYERGIRNPKLDTVRRIADALGVDMQSLYVGFFLLDPIDMLLNGGIPHDPYEDYELSCLKRAMQNMTDDEKKRLLQLAQTAFPNAFD